MNPLRLAAIHGYRLGTSPIRALRAAKDRRRGQVPIGILYYHRVADEAPTPWTIGRRDFRRQIEWLRSRFELVTLDEACRRIREGNDRPTVCLTFDDGYAENDDFALPWLADRGIPVMYYVSLAFARSGRSFPHDRQRGLELPPHRLEALTRWVGTSIEFGGHTRTHADLATLTDPRHLWDEIVTSSRELGAALGVPVHHFAAPYGLPRNLTPEVFAVAREGGLRTVASAYGGWNEIGGDAFHLQRMHGDPCLARVANWLTGDPRTLRVRRWDYGSARAAAAARFAANELDAAGERPAATASPVVSEPPARGREPSTELARH